MRQCQEAREAIKMAYFSIFCFGFVLGPLALAKGIGARKIIKDDPTLLGSGKALAAIVIGSFVLVWWAARLFVQFTA